MPAQPSLSRLTIHHEMRIPPPRGPDHDQSPP